MFCQMEVLVNVSEPLEGNITILNEVLDSRKVSVKIQRVKKEGQTIAAVIRAISLFLL